MKSILMLLVAVALGCRPSATIAQNASPEVGDVVSKGAVVRLKSGTALRFQERVFQTAQSNDEFVVLDVRKDQQMIYVAAADKSGSEIALSGSTPSSRGSQALKF